MSLQGAGLKASPSSSKKISIPSAVAGAGTSSATTLRRIDCMQPLPNERKKRSRRRSKANSRKEAVASHAVRQRFDIDSAIVLGFWSVSDLRSPSNERLQVRARFEQSYWPKKGVNTLFHGIALEDTGPLQTSALALAVDAVCLANAASASGNKSAGIQAVKLYRAALQSFQNAVNIAAQRRRLDSGLLATAQAMMFCERFSSIGSGDAGSYVHIKGLASVLTAQSLETFHSESDRLLLQDYHHYTNRHGLIIRRPIDRDLSEAWANYDLTLGGPFARMNQLVIRLPGLLEDTDNICKLMDTEPVKGGAEACVRAMNIISHLQTQERTLQSFLQEWYHGPPYVPVPAEDYVVYREAMPPDLLTIFPLALSFSSFSSAVGHCRFWVCLLLIRSAVASLLDAVVPEHPPIKLRTHNVDECAEELCQALIFLVGEPDNGIAGPAAVTAFLNIAYQWFRHAGDERKMEWCKALSRIVETKGLCPPDLSLGPEY